MAIPSFDDLYNLGKAELLLQRPDLFINEGDVSDVILNSAAAMADKCLQETVSALRKTFVATASGDDLTTLATDHWNITRNPATFSIGEVSFTRSAGPLLAGSIPIGTIIGTDFDVNGNRVEVSTDAAVAWILAETGTKTVAATATITGSDGNTAASTLSNIVSNIFDSNITVNNTSAFAGGNEEENDIELRERIRTFSLTLRRGTIAALEYGAKQVTEVRTATALEDVPAAGAVTVYVADSSGNSNATMEANVLAELENWRCAGIPLYVDGGTLVLQNVSVVINNLIPSSRTAFDVAARTADVQASVTAALEKLKIGDDLFTDYIISAIRQVDPDNIITVSLTIPAAHVINTGTQIFRAGTITVT